MTNLHEAKDSLQQAARNEWRRKGRKGTLAACTGTGKTKPAIDEMMEAWQQHKASAYEGTFGEMHHIDKPNFLVAVPTEQLRDVDWPNEVKQWYGTEGEEMWQLCVTAVCYISLHKVRGGYYDLVVLDEGHHLTELSAQFFKANVVLSVLCLTATVPDPKTEPVKYALLREIAPVVFVYPLEQGVDDGVVADFELNIVLSVLDNKKKIIPAGSKAKPFLQTEEAAYKYQHNRITALRIKVDQRLGDPASLAKSLQFMELARYRFMCNLPSKLALARAIIKKEHTENPEHPRTLVFAGSIEQATILCGEDVYHSKSPKTALQKFLDMELDLMGCVKALNEGVNIPFLDQEIICQVDSNPRSLVQRIGRMVRWRPGHVGKAFILCVQNTVDESWLKTALAGFDEKRIKYLTAKTYIP